MARVLSILLALLPILLFTGGAHAQSKGGGPVHILGLDSEEAEDQADALTGAIRSRARAQPGWSIAENAMSLSMLTAALKCPQRPDAACLGKIGDQLKTDRFIWGLLSKSGKGQVTAEVHLWTRGKADVMAKETFSDNLKDQNDETLRRIAARLFDRVVVGQGGGTLTVKAGEGAGAVLVDGQEKAQLSAGAATVELKPGSYNIEVRVPGYQPAKQAVTITAGAESTLALPLVPETATTPPAGGAGPAPPGGEGHHGGGSGRKILGWGLVAVGVAGVAVAIIEAVRWQGFQGKLDDQRANNYGVPERTSSGADNRVSDACNPPNGSTSVQLTEGCKISKDAGSTATIGFIAGGVGVAALGIGAILLLTDTSSASASATTGSTKPKPRVAPYASPTGGGVDLHVTF